MRLSRRTTAGFAAGLVLVVALALAPSASAIYDPLEGGSTRLTFDKDFLALLKQNGVKLTGRQSVGVHEGSATFPVSGGRFDPTTAQGTVEHEGALVFKAGHRSIPLKALQLKTTQRHAPFSAKVGGGQLKLASAAALKAVRAGFGDKVKVSTLKLSAKFAERLDKKLHLHRIFKAGQTIGSTVTKAKPVTVAIEATGKVAFTFSPGIVAKLESLFVAVSPIFPAEHLGSVFTLPILGGNLAPDASQGTLQASGSIELLQLHGGQLFWHDPWIDLGAKTMSAEVDIEPAPPYAGKVDRIPIASLSTVGAATSSDPRARTIGLSNVTAILPPAGAQTLNELFAKPQGKDNVFQAGEPLGTVSFTAQGQ